jgi:hypothetical protein
VFDAVRLCLRLNAFGSGPTSESKFRSDQGLGRRDLEKCFSKEDKEVHVRLNSSSSQVPDRKYPFYGGVIVTQAVAWQPC